MKPVSRIRYNQCWH